MVSLDKLKTLFAELLSDYESGQRDLMTEFGGDEEELRQEIADYQRRFDEALDYGTTANTSQA